MKILESIFEGIKFIYSNAIIGLFQAILKIFGLYPSESTLNKIFLGIVITVIAIIILIHIIKRHRLNRNKYKIM